LTSKKPADIAKARLIKRARQHLALVSGITPKTMRKTPSQKHSEAGRKKYLKRAGIKDASGIETVGSDCRGCTKDCRYENDLEICTERSLVLRCRKCGQKVRFRVINGVAWELCPVCAEMTR
jgi:hypothetical protein